MAPNNANNANNATSDQRVNGMQCNVKTALLKRNQVVGQLSILIDLGEEYVPNYIGVFKQMCNSTLEPELRAP